jgi:hypothetical protein
MPGAVKETPHATRIWKGTERKKDCFFNGARDAAGEETEAEDVIFATWFGQGPDGFELDFSDKQNKQRNNTRKRESKRVA